MLLKNRKGIICDISGERVEITNGTMEYYSVNVDKVDESSSERVLDLEIAPKVFAKWQEDTKTPRCAYCGGSCELDGKILFYKVDIKKVKVMQVANSVDDAFLKKMCNKCYESVRSEVLKVINLNRGKA